MCVQLGGGQGGGSDDDIEPRVSCPRNKVAFILGRRICGIALSTVPINHTSWEKLNSKFSVVIWPKPIFTDDGIGKSLFTVVLTIVNRADACNMAKTLAVILRTA